MHCMPQIGKPPGATQCAVQWGAQDEFDWVLRVNTRIWPTVCMCKCLSPYCTFLRKSLCELLKQLQIKLPAFCPSPWLQYWWVFNLCTTLLCSLQDARKACCVPARQVLQAHTVPPVRQPYIKTQYLHMIVAWYMACSPCQALLLSATWGIRQNGWITMHIHWTLYVGTNRCIIICSSWESNQTVLATRPQHTQNQSGLSMKLSTWWLRHFTTYAHRLPPWDTYVMHQAVLIHLQSKARLEAVGCSQERKELND